MLIQGDAVKIPLPDKSVHAIVTDPPYGLSFMGKDWDHGVPDKRFWKEALRVAKPGAHLLAFGGTRTFHRLAVAIEDAGWVIRDTVGWIYGSGFPKSHNVGKAIDKYAPRIGMFDTFAEHFADKRKASGKSQKDIAKLFLSKTGGITGCVWNWENGANVPTLEQWEILKPLLNLSDEWQPLIERIEAEREVVGQRITGAAMSNLPSGENLGTGGTVFGSGQNEVDITAPATEAAKQWDGWGTALKPAWEPVIVARKPFKGTVASNVLEHGTGAINIDGCRVKHNEPIKEMKAQLGGNKVYGQSGRYEATTELKPSGRWPANIIHDGSDEVLEVFPETKSGGKRGSTYSNENESVFMGVGTQTSDYYGSEGSAARFFYCAKASKKERNAGLEGMEEKRKSAAEFRPNHMEKAKKGEDGNPYGRWGKISNNHPTVKPIALMRYLCRLVTPPNGTVFDPFMGSGSTGVAAIQEGFEFIGCDIEAEYVEIAKRRIDKVITDGIQLSFE